MRIEMSIQIFTKTVASTLHRHTFARSTCNHVAHDCLVLTEIARVYASTNVN